MATLRLAQQLCSYAFRGYNDGLTIDVDHHEDDFPVIQGPTVVPESDDSEIIRDMNEFLGLTESTLEEELRSVPELVVLKADDVRGIRESFRNSVHTLNEDRFERPPQTSPTQTVTRVTVLDLIADIRTTAEEAEARKAYMLSWSLIWPFFDAGVRYRGWGSRVALRRNPPRPGSVRVTLSDDIVNKAHALVPEVEAWLERRTAKLEKAWLARRTGQYIKTASALQATNHDAKEEIAALRREWFEKARETFLTWLHTTQSAVYIVMNGNKKSILNETTTMRIVLKSSLPTAYQALLVDDDADAENTSRTSSTVMIDLNASSPASSSRNQSTLHTFREHRNLVVLVGNEEDSSNLTNILHIQNVAVTRATVNELTSLVNGHYEVMAAGHADAHATDTAYMLYWPLIWPLFYERSEHVPYRDFYAIFHEWLHHTQSTVYIVMRTREVKQRNEERLRRLNVRVLLQEDLPAEYLALLPVRTMGAVMTILRSEPLL